MSTPTDRLAIQALAVEKSFPGAARPALARLDVAVSRGSLTGVLGSNGGGKSTLLRVLAGILAPDHGTVRVLDQVPHAGARELRRVLAYVAQDPALDPELSGRETLILFGALFGLSRGEQRRRTEELLTQFCLSHVADQRLATCSGGERRRLHIAVSAIPNPLVMLLDEPTAGLDPDARAVVWDWLAGHARAGGVVVICTHDVADASARCDQVLLLHQGSLVGSGSPDALVHADTRDQPAAVVHLWDAYRALAQGPGARRPGTGGGRRRHQ